MENRRKDYRHHFPHPSGLRAELTSREAVPVRLSAEILDLSVGGAALQIPEKDVRFTPGSPWLIQFSLAGETALAMNATPVHGHTAGTPIVGFQFLPLVDPAAQEKRERTIFRYLLDEQRILRRARLGEW